MSQVSVPSRRASVASRARSVPPVTNGPRPAPLLDFGSWDLPTKHANCRRAATAALLAKRERLRNGLVIVSLDGDRGDATARREPRTAHATPYEGHSACWLGVSTLQRQQLLATHRAKHISFRAPQSSSDGAASVSCRPQPT